MEYNIYIWLLNLPVSKVTQIWVLKNVFKLVLKQAFARIFGPEATALSNMKVTTGAVCSIEGGMKKHATDDETTIPTTMVYDCACANSNLDFLRMSWAFLNPKSKHVISYLTRVLGFNGLVLLGKKSPETMCFFLPSNWLGFPVKQMFPLSNFSDSTSLRHFLFVRHHGSHQCCCSEKLKEGCRAAGGLMVGKYKIYKV